MTCAVKHSGRLGVLFAAAYFILALVSGDVTARQNHLTPKEGVGGRRLLPASSSLPVIEYAAHNRGNMQLAIGQK